MSNVDNKLVVSIKLQDYEWSKYFSLQECEWAMCFSLQECEWAMCYIKQECEGAMCTIKQEREWAMCAIKYAPDNLYTPNNPDNANNHKGIVKYDSKIITRVSFFLGMRVS